MVQAIKTLPHRQMEALDRATTSAQRATMNPNVATLARWLARKAYKEELRAMGRRPDQMEIGPAAWAYFAEHREEFIKEARNHPALIGR
jgi:hypothetical protein